VLKRFPDGATGEPFFQKRVPEKRPEWLQTVRVTFPSSRSADELCPVDAASVAVSLCVPDAGLLTGRRASDRSVRVFYAALTDRPLRARGHGFEHGPGPIVAQGAGGSGGEGGLR
jgi:DNA primase